MMAWCSWRRWGGSGNLSLTVDGTSSLEIGTAGGVAAGSLTIDAGLTVPTTTGTFTAPHIIDKWHARRRRGRRD